MRRLPLVFLAGLFLLLTRPLFGQAYAPETEYHDRVQRHFVVEYARVLGWRENDSAKAAKVAEIKYTLATGEDRVTTWKIQWCDATGAALHEAKVSYPEAALLEGPAWYRNVAAQLGFGAPGTALTEPDLVRSYWAGAERSLPSRSGSLAVLLTLSPASHPAEAAGLLTHATLPSLATELSLDAVLLARGAAWLCLAEHAIAQPSPQLDALWAPTLFLAGRENAAAALWKKAAAPAPTALGKWWAFLLSGPSSTEVFAFAADPQYRRWAMPLLVYQALRYNLGASFFQVFRHFADEPGFAYSLHDYGIFFARDGGVSTGRIMEGAWPYVSRSAWGQLMRSFQPEPLDYRAYQPVLAKWTPKPWPKADELSIAELTDAAPLLNLAFTEGTGKLTPTALVTARDLLNYGWELNGSHLSARWQFVEGKWGVREIADAIARASLPTLQGLPLFFEANPEHLEHFPAELREYFAMRKQADLLRVQELSAPAGRQPGGWHRFDSNRKRNALLWPRRCWLRPDLLWHQCSSLGYADLAPDAAALLARVVAEGGPLLESRALATVAFPPTKLKIRDLPETRTLRDALLARTPEPSSSTEALLGEGDQTMPPFERAQKNEKLFWKRPGSDLAYNAIFLDYLRAHAYGAAKRFYAEADPLLEDRVGTSNSIGPARFILALYEDDRKGMLQAMVENSSGSFIDMLTSIDAAAAAGDFPGIARQVDECLQRYTSKSSTDQMNELKAFLPLLPALKDRRHPDHAKALDYFKTSNQWTVLQYVLATHLKLSPEEAVRFLGGPEATGARLALVRYFLKDRDGFAQAREAFASSPASRNNTRSTDLLICLENDLLAKPAAPPSPDLKPAGIKTVTEAFDEAYKRLNPVKKGNRT